MLKNTKKLQPADFEKTQKSVGCKHTLKLLMQNEKIL